jgi:hypothetical protein
MSYWSSLIAAFEGDLQVLEEARSAYLAASQSLLKRVGDGVARRELGAAVTVTMSPSDPDDESIIADSQWLRVRCRRRDELPGLELAGWIASAWGGPAASLRLGVVLDEPLPYPLSVMAERWVKIARESLPDLPGEPYAPERHLDAGGGQWLRICTLPLGEREESEILSEAIETASALLKGGLQALDGIENAARPLLAAYTTLRDLQPGLLERGARLRAEVSPNKDGKLGGWQGRDYLQISKFWVGIEPKAMRVLAEAYEHESEVLDRLARGLGRAVEKRVGYPSLVLLEGEELGSPTAREVIARAFDTWMEWKIEQDTAATP